MKFRFINCFRIEISGCAVVCIMIIVLIGGVIKILFIRKLKILLSVGRWIFSYLK